MLDSGMCRLDPYNHRPNNKLMAVLATICILNIHSTNKYQIQCISICVVYEGFFYLMTPRNNGFPYPFPAYCDGYILL